jgi:hypothetical protein
MAPFRRVALPRSGRIHFEGAAKNDTITIAEEVAGNFRIFNTDSTPFKVKPGTFGEVEVQQRCSVDVVADGDIVITAVAAGDLKGIYELINVNTQIRSGKFRRDGDFQISQNLGRKAFYRILNTHKDHAFDVEVNGNAVTTVQPRMAVDVAARNRLTISAANRVSGIYDYLDPRNVIQPGRFNVELPTTTDSHTIIYLGGSSERAIYRVHNSGPTPLIIKRGAVEIAAELKQDRSIDFVVPPDNGADPEVNRVTISAAAASSTVRGMFEYIGPTTTWLDS